MILQHLQVLASSADGPICPHLPPVSLRVHVGQSNLCHLDLLMAISEDGPLLYSPTQEQACVVPSKSTIGTW